MPLNDQCMSSMGPDGLEPSLARVRTECAAANTLIPRLRRESRSEKVESRRGGNSFLLSTFSPPISLRPCRSGAGGIRTPAGQIKSLLCCRYTTTPIEDVVPFVREVSFHNSLLVQSLGVELNHRCRLIRTTCFRYTTKRSRDGRTRTDDSVRPKHVGCRSPTSR